MTIVDESFVNQWYGRVYALCQSMLRDRVDAEEAAQETFIRLIERQRRSWTQSDVAPPAEIGAYLRAVARNVCVDVIRGNVRRKSVRGKNATNQTTVPSQIKQTAVSRSGDCGENVLNRIEDRERNPTETVAEADVQQKLINQIFRLPDDLREVVLLHYYQSLSYEEIAQWLGIARSTVNARLSKARNSLRRDLILDGVCDEVS